MNEACLSSTFCTDNRLISATSVTKEICLALEHLDLTPRMLKSSIIYGFKRSFLPGTYLQKRDYVREIIDYYDKIWSEFAASHPDDPFCKPENRDRHVSAVGTSLSEVKP